MIRIMIVDDHKLMIDSIAKCLDEIDDFEVVQSTTESEISDICCELCNPDVILMDICTGNRQSGIDAASKIKETFSNIKIIMMTGFSEIGFVKKSKEIGADGFIYKSAPFSDIEIMIRKVMSGHKIFPEETKTFDVKGVEFGLTEREIQILRLECQPLSRKEIADILCISENTLKKHIANILKKTKYRTITSLAIYFVSKGYIVPAE